MTCSINERVFTNKYKKLAHVIKKIAWAKICNKKENLPQVFC